MTKLIVWLGNPWEKYTYTRHNAWWIVLDQWTKDQWYSNRSHESIYSGNIIRTNGLILLKPTTFMNLSGQSVQRVCSFWKILPQDILVLHDEIDLGFGQIKMKQGGWHAWHNGLRDMITKLGTNNFSRIRIGVGRPEAGSNVADYVLSPFSNIEKSVLHKHKLLIAELISERLRLS